MLKLVLIVIVRLSEWTVNWIQTLLQKASYTSAHRSTSLRGHPFTTSAKYPGFLTPSLVCIGQVFTRVDSRNLPYFVHFSTNPSPSPLSWRGRH